MRQNVIKNSIPVNLSTSKYDNYDRKEVTYLRLTVEIHVNTRRQSFDKWVTELLVVLRFDLPID